MNSNNLLGYAALLIVVLLVLTVLQKLLLGKRPGNATYKAKRVLSAPEAVLFLRPEHLRVRTIKPDVGWQLRCTANGRNITPEA